MVFILNDGLTHSPKWFLANLSCLDALRYATSSFFPMGHCMNSINLSFSFTIWLHFSMYFFFFFFVLLSALSLLFTLFDQSFSLFQWFFHPKSRGVHKSSIKSFNILLSIVIYWPPFDVQRAWPFGFRLCVFYVCFWLVGHSLRCTRSRRLYAPPPPSSLVPTLVIQNFFRPFTILWNQKMTFFFIPPFFIQSSIFLFDRLMLFHIEKLESFYFAWIVLGV